MDSTLPKCTPGVDWITLTTGADDDADEAYQRARALAVEQVANGDRLRPWGVRGYSGFGTRHLRCGHRDGDVLVELSGQLADRYWREFACLARSVSRFDTKTDVTFPRPVHGLAVDAYKAPGVPLGPNLPAISKTLYTGSAGGETCYVGAMGGRRLGRLYDKSAESRGEFPPNTWRYELQERKPFSSLTCNALRNADDVPHDIAAHLFSFYSRHGIKPWFKADSVDLPTLHRRTNTDLSVWLNWLRVQVAPGVRRWSERGHADAIVNALGLAVTRGSTDVN